MSIGSAPSRRERARRANRYRQTLIPAELAMRGERAEVILKEPHYVPPGQSLVLYRGDRCLGGGVIEDATLV